VFYGENGEAEFDFAKFRDDHPYEWLTFKESFVYSSNICTIKAVMDSDKRDFYSFILDFGFGGRTGVDLPAESKGRLQEPSSWSGRSMASIAIGQEIGVTVMQMAMAYCAVANGGNLVTPRVAIEAREPDGTISRKFPVIEVRRIFSEETCRTMVEFCRAAVKNGTGTNAAIQGLDVAGKTGTAQKSNERGYIPNKYIASFAGFAPASDPRLVCLVLLDEPSYAYHYGGTSAAIVFRKIFEGINMSTDIFAGTENSTLAVREASKDRVQVPSFLRMNAKEAEEVASDNGLRLKYSISEGEIFSQIPGPGSFIDKDGEVTVAFRHDGEGRRGPVPVPDLRGLSTRKARRMLLELGLQMKIEGYGKVSRQDPRPGVMVAHGSCVSIRCNPRIATGWKDHGRGRASLSDGTVAGRTGR
ncbi:MAG TPA: penicillin-binding transpeptidase domain-containing protein, partial [Candidatus Krumholzibacterium sp.]|nr:penicillin-binding transpeptidase domain-containing protein [Candidatus Krumholzibacterium sp.]